jgi:midasin (ATPase involved in ribosome maturation)
MTEKFDIIDDLLFRYDSEMQEQESSVFNDNDFKNAFIDNEDLLTINVSQPIKRIVKFYNIQFGIPESFEELEYDLMTAEQKTALDNFITNNSI